MEFKDIKTWVVNTDHKARPKNIYDKDGILYASWYDSEAFATQHTYTVDESLKPGEYPAEMFDSPVWQYKPVSTWIALPLTTMHEDVPDYAKRQYLLLKPASKEPEVKQQGGEETHVTIQKYDALQSQLNNQANHKESIKQYWLSCSESKKKWVEAIKEYFDEGHTEIKTFEEFKYQFDLD